MRQFLGLALLVCAQVSFGQDKHSGIIGESRIFCCPVAGPGIDCPNHLYPTTIAVYSEKGRLLETVTTDDNGVFAMFLKPGLYTLVPAGPPQPEQTDPNIPPPAIIYPASWPIDVRVEK